MKALLVAPVFDEITSYSYEWSREAKKILEEAGYEVIDLSKREVSRTEVENAIANVDFFTFWNHGTENALWGSRNEAVINLKNAVLLNGKEVYTLACLSAKKLGVKAYKEGAKAYWGYTSEFAFSTEAIEAFKTFAIAGIRFKFKEGKSWSESLKEAKKLAKQLASKLAKEGKLFSAILLRSNAEALVCYNNAEPPQTTCPLRKAAILLFGSKIGWKLSGRDAVAPLLFGIGLGLAVHDFFVECATPLRFPPHGFYWGILCMFIGFVMAYHEILKSLRGE